MENESITENEKRLEGSQARFDLKAIEVLVKKLKSITQAVPVEQQPAFRDSLFAATPTLTELLARHAIQSDDDITLIVEKLEVAKDEIEKGKTRTIPIEEERKITVEKEAANDNEGKRERVMEIQETINDLYQLNQQIEEQQERLQEELALLNFFVIEKTEEDVDVRHTQARIQHYYDEIESLEPEPSPGFLNRFLKKSTPSSENEERIQELNDKIIKAQDGLDAKYQQLQAKEEKIRARLREVQMYLGESFEEDGVVNDWQKLVQQSKDAFEKLKTKLDEEYEQRKITIKEREDERDSIASLKELV